MAPTGFEPATPGLRVQYSNRAELRGLKKLNSTRFKNVLQNGYFYIKIVTKIFKDRKIKNSMNERGSPVGGEYQDFIGKEMTSHHPQGNPLGPQRNTQYTLPHMGLPSHVSHEPLSREDPTSQEDPYRGDKTAHLF